ncbi:MAG: JAB-like toxin 1 domain-containing protein [Bacteroidales bacterium]|nr:JAB-like toxin 1 domain-containing protein [Bacteroidales bacterium]
MILIILANVENQKKFYLDNDFSSNNLPEFIEYTYYYNQLTGINYPLNPEQNVKYEYGDNQAGNNAGRLILQEDATGLQSFSYGKMGELIENIRTFVLPEDGFMTFKTQWTYDSWNRIKELVYPDGEILTYNYDNGGQLIEMYGLKDSYDYYYVDLILYDKFGSRTFLQYSNDIGTTYSYEPERHRLSEIYGIDTKTTNDTVQYVKFYYDEMDNIERLDKSADRGVQGVSYNMEMTYQYDDFYRLTDASGYNYSNAGDSSEIYNYQLSYSPSGNVLSKTVNADILTVQGLINVDYDNSYSYNNGQPHTISRINNDEITFDWDANGNMTQWYNNIFEIRRNMCWDEENRLKVVYDQGLNLSSYLYDASGERTLKLQGPFQSMLINGQYWYNFYDISNYILYTSPYMVITPETYTKHYYIESDRVVSKIGGGLRFSIHDINEHVYGFEIQDEDDYEQKSDNNLTMMFRDFECAEVPLDEGFGVDVIPDISFWLKDALDMNEDEKAVFFYHKDHLGSSTQISDQNADIIHHIEYLPYGENFFEMRDYWGTDYKFNAKELDNETGMYYYGARYFIPELSIWGSVDPLSDERPSLSPYNYCQWNPVMRVDPTGMLDDEWEVNKQGQIVNRVPNTNEDSFHIVDDNGNRINGQSISFAYETVKDEIKENFQFTSNKQETLFAFEIDSEQNAEKLFEFMADPQNTNVEWANAKTDDNRSFVGNTQGKNEVSMANYLIQFLGYNLTRHTHSHLPTSLFGPDPSDPDLSSKQHFTPNCKLYIYFPPNKNSVDRGYRGY